MRMPVDLMNLRDNALSLMIKEDVISWSERLEGSGEQRIWNDKGVEVFSDRECYWIWWKKEGNESWQFCFIKHGNEYFDNNPNNRFLFNGTIHNNNLQDMKPVIFHNRLFLNFNPEFNHFYNFVDYLHEHNLDETLSEIGLLLLRDAFYLEHKREATSLYHINRENNEIEPMPYQLDNYFFLPDPDRMKRITDVLPTFTIDGVEIDTEVFLHYIDGIAQNEAVKYHHKLTINDEIMDTVVIGAGRENCLLTLINYIECRKSNDDNACNRIRIASQGKKVLSISEDVLNERGYHI